MANDRQPQQKTLHALGLCAKARKLISGTPMVCEALRGAKKPCLVLEAAGNSQATAKRIADKCAYYGVLHIRAEIDGETLASAIGKTGRVAVVAITDENLYRLVYGTLKQTVENPIG